MPGVTVVELIHLLIVLNIYHVQHFVNRILY